MVLFGVLLYIHIGSALLWVGPTTGAYLLVRETDSVKLVRKYRKLVEFVEVPSATLLFLTGLLMSWYLGFPGWTKVALSMGLPIAIVEGLHYMTCSRASSGSELRGVIDSLVVFWTTVTPLLLFLMIFEPKL
ncbi:hypothetical protein HS1genome_2102 [Sulfodiicoccus acidiphilus]|uniref:Protoporphyrinogen IX oxidase n=1 Tax=Sulfodiicoccus acidiphilus TaxID=1670455 RepID=A0A348B6B1_9CREN|nr:hypothetical protein [Sulfodiicoccus acidiphilus]BBD73713.1 hypothetical protein HS1genome_2102 [Sulfodiicoccus acidiphilus]GGT97816.1 hypothetical protein GCM10007116_14190 [Sulfodiicoccus acidiphilus]